MTHEELQAIKATLVGLRSETPLGGNDSDTALDIGETLVAEVERLRELVSVAWQRGWLAHIDYALHDTVGPSFASVMNRAEEAAEKLINPMK